MTIVILDSTAYLLWLALVAILAIMIAILTRICSKGQRNTDKLVEDQNKMRKVLVQLLNKTDDLSNSMVHMDHLLYNQRKREVQFYGQTREAFKHLFRNDADILSAVKKGNKDQQEIKTRLTWSKKRELSDLKAEKKTIRRQKS